MKPYNIFAHGIGSRVYNKHTKEYGIVAEIKETLHEVIEPFILYDKAVSPTRENDNHLMFVEDGDGDSE